MCINYTFFYLWQFKLLNGKNKFTYKYCKSKIIIVTFPLLEMEAKTLQIFKLTIWLKIHYSFVTIISKHPWSCSISFTVPCPRLHTAYSSVFSFPLIGNRDFCSITFTLLTCPQTRHSCCVLGRRDSSRELKIHFFIVMEV